MVTWSVVRTRSSHLCPVRSPFVSLLLQALGVVQLGPGRVPGLFILHAGGLMVHLEVDDNFCFSLQVVFRYSRLRVFRSMCAAGRRSHTFTRCLHVRLFHPCSRPVLFPGSYGPHVFLARSGFPAIFLCPSQPVYTPACRTGARWWLVLVNRTSHPTSTRCPSVDGTSFARTVARTLMKRRVIALPGRSQTPRRSQTPLASGQRGDGHGTARSLLSLSGVGGLTNDSCELPLC